MGKAQRMILWIGVFGIIIFIGSAIHMEIKAQKPESCLCKNICTETDNCNLKECLKK